MTELTSATALHSFIDSHIASCIFFLDLSPFAQSIRTLVPELQSEFPSIQFAYTTSSDVMSEAKVTSLPETLFFLRGAQFNRRYDSFGTPSIPWIIENLEQLAQTQSTSISERLTALINQKPIMLFLKGSPAQPVCGFSRQIVALLAAHGVEDYGHFDILKDEEVRQHLKVFSNWPTYPQLYCGGVLVGGLDIVKELASEGVLRKELNL